MRLLLALSFCMLSLAAAAQAPEFGVPEWLFPGTLPPPAIQPVVDDVKLIHIPNSKAAFTAAQIGNRFFVPDWHPQTHGPLPDVVARGRLPSVFACGYCHMPQGQGRPENAPLAGLPAQYIVRQVEDFKSGARRGAGPVGYGPTLGMIQVAKNLTSADLVAAAEYFAAQHMSRRTTVIEAERVPELNAVGWIYTPKTGKGTEPLGERLLEVAPNLELHERRADGPIYKAYVSKGSIARGNTVAHFICAECHGEGLRGVGLVPPLAGRSPSYILRQLVGFRTGARAAATGEPMRGVVAEMDINKMMDVAAYAGSLQP